MCTDCFDAKQAGLDEQKALIEALGRTIDKTGREVAESGRLARPSGAACAKRPHGRLRRLSAELENVGETSGKPPTF